MRGLFAAVFHFFLTPLGLPILAVFDASLIFFFPLGIDIVLIIMTARKPELAWLYPVLATIGSTIGAAFTFWLGRKIGEHGLERFVDARQLDRIKKRISTRAAISTGVLALAPPPFPFTGFILASGALDVSRVGFFTTFAGARLLRFGVDAALAAMYGRHIIRWIRSDTFQWIMGGFIVIAIAGTAFSAWKVFRSTKRSGDHEKVGRAA